MNSARKKSYNEFHDLLFEFQRVQRFKALEVGVGHDQLGDGLNHTEESILFVLDAGSATNVKDLAEEVGLERSWMSRTVAGLEERGFLVSRPDPEDGRSKILKLTREGEKQLVAAEQNAKKILERSFAVLSATKQREFEKLLTNVADNLGAHKFDSHRAGHSIGYQLGRISAVIGIYARTLFGTDITNTQLHVFLILDKYNDTPLQISDIDRAVSFDMSTVSRTIQNFVDNDIVEKTKGTRDKRSVALVLSKKGKEVFSSYRQQSLKVLAAGLDPLSDTQLTRLLELYRELTKDLPQPNPVVTKPSLTMKPIAKGGRSQSTTSPLLSKLKISTQKGSNQKHLGAYKGSKLVAAVNAEFSDSDGSLSSLTLVNDGADVQDCRALVEECLKSKR